MFVSEDPSKAPHKMNKFAIKIYFRSQKTAPSMVPKCYEIVKVKILKQLLKDPIIGQAQS
jgi:hypothetical protein